MYKILTVENMRKSDAYTIANFTPSKELMYRAGKGAYEATVEHMSMAGAKSLSPIAIVCGSGNNAGDGYVMASLFYEAGADVTIILLKEKFSPDGQFYFDKCRELGIPVEIFSTNESCTSASDDTNSQAAEHNLSRFNLIIDCILGTGFKGDVRGVAAEAIEAINNSHTKTVSVDINSGLNGDTGRTKLAVKSDLTISVGGYKTGHFLGDSRTYIKSLKNIDIGIEPVDKPYLLVTDVEICKLTAQEKSDNIVVNSLENLEKHICN